MFHRDGTEVNVDGLTYNVRVINYRDPILTISYFILIKEIDGLVEVREDGFFITPSRFQKGSSDRDEMRKILKAWVEQTQCIQ